MNSDPAKRQKHRLGNGEGIIDLSAIVVDDKYGKDRWHARMGGWIFENSRLTFFRAKFFFFTKM